MHINLHNPHLQRIDPPPKEFYCSARMIVIVFIAFVPLKKMHHIITSLCLIAVKMFIYHLIWHSSVCMHFWKGTQIQTLQVTHILYLHIHCVSQWWDHFSITDTYMTLHPLTWEFAEEECSRPPQRNVGRWCLAPFHQKERCKPLHSCRSLFLECGNKPSIFQKIQ